MSPYRILSLISLTAILLILAGCATAYQKNGITGGYYDKDLGKGVWRVGFSGNGYINDETTQVYWLYRCCEVALENGYDGFRILSDIRLSESVTPQELWGEKEKSTKAVPAQYYIPIIVSESYKPHIKGDIMLLRSPVEHQPPVVFDARKLKASLDEVMPKKGSNVEPHRHDYVYPMGTFDDEGEAEAPPSEDADLDSNEDNETAIYEAEAVAA